jgi:indolepyruvate ferredoxin oxidoreductase alpha subunit
MGNEAIAFAAVEAGVNVACGYPGTPSTEIVETIAAHNPGGRVHVEWSTNEKAALELAAGASYAGARVIMTCKQVGMNVASDPLMSLAYVGTRGGLVIVVADDPGPISSQTEQDSRQFAQFAHVPVLDPATPEEAYAMTLAAFELSEAHGTPVILRPTTRVDHGCASIDVPADLAACPAHPVAGFAKDPNLVIFPPLANRAHGRMSADLVRVAREFDASPFNHLEEHLRDDYELYLGIACGGDSRGYVREALSRLSDAAAEADLQLPSYRLFEVGTPYPFPEGLGRDFLLGLADALVVEELEPVIERSLLQLTGPIAADAIRIDAPASIHGRLDGTTPVAGEYSSDLLVPVIAQFLGVPELAGDVLQPARAVAEKPPAELVPPRPPTLCAGCPHRASFLAVKEAAKSRSVVYSGDIGCYTLGCNAPLNATDTCLCMGAGVTVAQGIETADRLAGRPDVLHVGFVGDSTFFASGMTGLANAVYNRHRMVLCVLDNGTTAMTGSQPHPGTGLTLMGTRSKPIDIPAVCEALGADLVEVVDPLDRTAAREAAEKALACEGVSVLVFQSPCVQLFRALEPVRVDAGRCMGCGRCVRATGCPALSMAAPDPGARRGQAVVDPQLCYGCDLCLGYCSFNALASSRAGMEPAACDALRRGETRA